MWTFGTVPTVHYCPAHTVNSTETIEYDNSALSQNDWSQCCFNDYVSFGTDCLAPVLAKMPWIGRSLLLIAIFISTELMILMVSGLNCAVDHQMYMIIAEFHQY